MTSIPMMSRPLVKVKSTDLIPGDLFESDGNEVVSISPVAGDPSQVLVTYIANELTSKYVTEAETEHLVRREYLLKGDKEIHPTPWYLP